MAIWRRWTIYGIDASGFLGILVWMGSPAGSDIAITLYRVMAVSTAHQGSGRKD
jgi:hypothetical protein